MKKIIDNRYVFWALLAIPALPLLGDFIAGRFDPAEATYATGEWSARLMIVAVTLGPLAAVFPSVRIFKWLIRRRRYFGVASFTYAALHLAFYLVERADLPVVVAEALELGIWTGWAAFILMVPLALTSNDASVRALRRNWKRLHRLVYPAVLLVALHWTVIGDAGALVWFAPFVLLNAARFVKRRTPRAGADSA